ncbi:hypothetical protein chiPu_0022471 [Chiloscyllium punctatum]|uniref:Uncharacterized protein n=1 Tax=Chiloscyllium punctatum TaxID=137246 RepID=A0A401RG92_CHIPU|nr:hypothetical protein [Chiloscyllium punctatum]
MPVTAERIPGDLGSSARGGSLSLFLSLPLHCSASCIIFLSVPELQQGRAEWPGSYRRLSPGASAGITPGNV